jgi:hypothetical protein
MVQKFMLYLTKLWTSQVTCLRVRKWLSVYNTFVRVHKEAVVVQFSDITLIFSWNY